MSEEVNKEEQENTPPESLEVKEGDSKEKECGVKCDRGKACAVLAYFVVGIIWYFVDEDMKKNDLVKFHVKQALGLVIADLVLMTALAVSIIGLIAMPLLKLVALVLAIVWILNAVNGDKKELPIIGKYSSKFLNF